MKYRGWMILVALAMPVVALAQRGGGGRGGGGSADGIDENGPLDNGIKSKDVVKMNPATVLIAKAKDLKLDDGERTRLTDIAKRYDWNANIFSRVADSLQNVVDSRRSAHGGRGRGQGGGSGGASSDSVRSPDEILAARKQLLTTLVNIRTEYDTASARSLNALTDAQRSKANTILDKPSKDLADMLRKAGGP